MSSSIPLVILLCLLTILSIAYLHSDHARPSAKRPRVLCLILTTPDNLRTRARAVNVTWGPRCDGYFFITELPLHYLTVDLLRVAKQLPIAPIKNIEPGYIHLTQKTTLAFLFAYQHYANEFDWFLKADDDTYVLVEHLRDFLSTQDTSTPVTFGYNFKMFVPKGYHSGGASYVLSRESLRRFSQAHLRGNTTCRRDGGSEDVEIARCLRRLGVTPGRSLDEHQRELFHPLPFSHHFRGMFPDWLHLLAEHPLKMGDECCGERSISFHYVTEEDLYLMDFLFLS